MRGSHLSDATLHTSFHLEVMPFGLALTNIPQPNGEPAFLESLSLPPAQSTQHPSPVVTEGQAGCLAVLNFGMWLRGPRRLLLPHLQYFRFLVLRSTRSPIAPSQARGHLHKAGVNTGQSHAQPADVGVQLAPRLLLTNCSVTF